MPGDINRLPDWEDYLWTSRIFEDFQLFATAAPAGATVSAADADEMFWLACGWKIIKDASASVLLNQSRLDGHLNITTSNTNQEAYFYSKEMLFFQSSRFWQVICRFDFPDNENTEEANFIFGAMADVAADALIDGGGGPATGQDQALIWRNQDDDFYHCGASLAANVNPDHKSQQKFGTLNNRTSQYQDLRITCNAVRNESRVSYEMDPAGLGGFEPLTNSAGQPIVDVFDRTGAELMSFVIGMKSKGASAAQNIFVDFMGASQHRSTPSSPP